MSWHFSRALVGDFLRQDSSDGQLFAQLKTTIIALNASCKDKTKDILKDSPYGQTYVPSKDLSGNPQWISLLAAFLAKHSVRQHTEYQQPKISGTRWIASLVKLNPKSFSRKMSPLKPFQKQPKIAASVDIELLDSPFLRKTWAQTIAEIGTGFLHTPTTAANYLAPSMFQHQGCENYIRVFGQKNRRDGKKNPSTKGTGSTAKNHKKQNAGALLWPYEANETPRPNPLDQEWLMGWVPGWTDTEPLETGKFLSWQLQHFQS